MDKWIPLIKEHWLPEVKLIGDRTERPDSFKQSQFRGQLHHDTIEEEPSGNLSNITLTQA